MKPGYWRQFTKYFALLTVIAFLASPPPAAYAQASDAGRPAVGKYVKAYKSSDGITVWTTRLGEPDDHKALIQFGGADNPYDLKILAADVEQTGKDSRYSITHDGKKFVLFILSDGAGELYLPGTAESIRTYYDEEASQQSNSEHFLTDYLDQKN